MDMKLEVVPIPVRDVDAAKDFYTRQAGFRLDHDVSPSQTMRVVQMTPPGSACSVVIGEGLPLGEPGSVKGVQLVVEDLDAVRSELAGRGVAISEVQQMGPEGTPGSRYCFFEDPDGNMWAVQEYKAHLAGGSRPGSRSSAQPLIPCRLPASTPPVIHDEGREAAIPGTSRRCSGRAQSTRSCAAPWNTPVDLDQRHTGGSAS